MTKNRNQRLYSDNPAQLRAWADEFEYIGRKYKIEPGVLIVFAVAPKRSKKKNKKSDRNKRAESAGRRQ